MISVFNLKKGEGDLFFERLAERNRFESGETIETVYNIIQSVKSSGDEAVLKFTRLFDRVDIEACELRVSDEEIMAACQELEDGLKGVIRRAAERIREFHQKQKENSWFTAHENGVLLGQIVRPLETVGVYVPGGTAPLTSSVLMNIIPAKVAGVGKVIMATPPSENGSINPAVLAAAKEAGADEIYRVGGAQAIAAMAFGTGTIPKVDKIIGPGNIYVAAAKRLVFGYCDIDMFAGPSEIAVVADETADPVFVAADLLSQAEHDVLASSILITTSEKLAQDVRAEMERQVKSLERKDIAQKSLSDFGAALISESVEEALDIVNRIAPEHLELYVKEPFNYLGMVKNAGAIFLGPFSPEPLGDYFAGPNHVLPTGGTARFFSPLNVGDFVKKSSVISYTEAAFKKDAGDVIKFAESEGLTAHANAIRVRLEYEK